MACHMGQATPEPLGYKGLARECKGWGIALWIQLGSAIFVINALPMVRLFISSNGAVPTRKRPEEFLKAGLGMNCRRVNWRLFNGSHLARLNHPQPLKRFEAEDEAGGEARHGDQSHMAF